MRWSLLRSSNDIIHTCTKEYDNLDFKFSIIYRSVRVYVHATVLCDLLNKKLDNLLERLDYYHYYLKNENE